jgi:hypothetical protein
LVVSVLLVLLLSFNVSYSTGKLSVDRTQQTPFAEWFWLSIAIWWTVSSYTKQASSRVRIRAVVVVVPLVALIAVASFRTGRSEGTPMKRDNSSRHFNFMPVKLSDLNPSFLTRGHTSVIPMISSHFNLPITSFLRTSVKS